MFGLVIVVLLLSIIMTVVIGISMTKKPSTVRQNFQSSQQVTSFLQTMLQTETKCNKVKVSELLSDCLGPSHTIDCDMSIAGGTLGTYQGTTFDSCIYAYQTLHYIMSRTFEDEQFSRQYILRIFTGSDASDHTKYVFRDATTNLPWSNPFYSANIGGALLRSYPAGSEGVISSPSDPTNPANNGVSQCPGDMESMHFIIPSQLSPIVVKLELCR
ncbi:hypothetical protein J4460_00325 [Candidatus Woesearchaeota archaeon]|nr:MAG: hypothetical protein QS99_C0002G0123 [archaeon GW2011_AR4]MBS3129095.1 hypothetical protein [Candidatus Woesearchaeota archaeon]HIH49279.1 hypothetical protein [Candidatus Woesearchaeota archaeon]HIJ03952.1 hypothetical protein [Candidatus Woesearchaeota archaeon]